MTETGIDFYNVDQSISDRMPLVDLVVDRHCPDRPLEGVTALFFQHQLANQVAMTRGLIALGLEQTAIHWVDIPYTARAPVRQALQELGIPPANFHVSHDYGLLDPYAPYQRRRALRIYGELLAEDPETLLVLDDGAYFLEAASCFERRPRRCAIVEQTSRGFKKLEKNATMRSILAEVPLVDVARSVPKRRLESPFVGAAVCAAVAHHLRDRLDSGPDKRCLVIGYGHIGSSVAEFLTRSGTFDPDQVFVVDPRFEREELETPFRVWDGEHGGKFDLVVGASGNTSFDVGDAIYLKDGAVMVSASSGAMEFNRRNVVEWAASSETDDLWIGEVADPSNLHAEIPIHFPGRDVTMLNGGFPANFDGRVCCVPNRYIQITLALMTQGAVQGVRAARGGLAGEIPIDPEVCLALTRAYYDDLARGLPEGGLDAAGWLPPPETVLHEIRYDHSI